MSGGRVASYQLSEAQLAHLREQARQRERERQWAVLFTERGALAARADELGKRFKVPALRVASLSKSAVTEESLARETVTTQALRRQLHEITVVGRAAMARSVVQSTGASGAKPVPVVVPANTELGGSSRPAVKAVAAHAVAKPENGEAGRLVSKLDPEADIPTLDALLGDIAHATPPIRRLLLARLRTQVEQANATVRHGRDEARALAELEAVAAQTQDPSLLAALEAARSARPVDIKAVRAIIERVLSQQETEAEFRLVRQVVAAAYEQNGYEVIEGFDVQTAKDGVLVRLKPDADHGVRISVSQGNIDLRPVLLADAANPAGAARLTGQAERIAATAAEKEFCDRVQPVLRSVGQAGLAVRTVSEKPAGASRPARARVSKRGRKTGRSQAKEMEIGRP